MSLITPSPVNKFEYKYIHFMFLKFSKDWGTEPVRRLSCKVSIVTLCRFSANSKGMLDDRLLPFKDRRCRPLS